MHKAVERNMIEMMDLFIQCGGDPAIPNKHGFTCLHVAAKAGLVDMCKFLINKGKFQTSTFNDV